MADMVINYAYVEPGDLWRDLTYLAMERLGDAWGGFYDVSITLGDQDGHRRIQLVVDFASGAEIEYFNFVLVTVASTETAPLRFFQNSPGFQGMAYPTLGGIVVDEPFLVYAESYIMDLLIDAKQSILFEWAGAGGPLPGVLREDLIPDKAAQFQTWIPASANGDVILSADRFMIANTFDNVDPEDYSTPLLGFSNPQPTPGYYASSGGIVKALNDIAMQDSEISLNSGRSLFSVRSRVITGQ